MTVDVMVSDITFLWFFAVCDVSDIACCHWQEYKLMMYALITFPKLQQMGKVTMV